MKNGGRTFFFFGCVLVTCFMVVGLLGPSVYKAHLQSSALPTPYLEDALATQLAFSRAASTKIERLSYEGNSLGITLSLQNELDIALCDVVHAHALVATAKALSRMNVGQDEAGAYRDEVVRDLCSRATQLALASARRLLKLNDKIEALLAHS